MAVYVVNLEIPPNTPRETPRVVKQEIKEPIFHQLIVFIPSGVWCLAGVQALYGIDQFIPLKKGKWIIGSGESIVFPILWESPETPWTLTLKGFNEDDTYSHTYYLRICTQKREIAYPWLPIKSFVKTMRKVIGV